tara:strand:+ start:180 stop:917 length:738 start_codon:yes stop_codon:yes gene_type:complete
MRPKKRRKYLEKDKRLPGLQDDSIDAALLRMRRLDRRIEYGTEQLLNTKQHKNIKNLIIHAISSYNVPHQHETMLFYKVMYMLDKVLAKKKVKEQQIEMYAMTCLVIQWKMELIIHSPGYEDIAYYLDDIDITAKHLMNIELEILQILDYQCYVVTAYDFVRAFMCYGCYYHGQFEREEFLALVTNQIDKLQSQKFSFSIRQFRSESIAYLCIWRARKRSLGPLKKIYNKQYRSVYIKDLDKKLR